MTSKIDTKLYQELQRKQRDSEKEVLGIEDVKNDAHARAAIQIIDAYSKGRGFIYIEAHLPNKTNKPSDIVLCDESVGVVVFEVKGDHIENIRKYSAGKLKVERRGSTLDESPWDQASDNMFAVKNQYERNNRQNLKEPPFHFFAFFPHIEKKQWLQRLGETQLDYTIFQDDAAIPTKLRGKIASKIQSKVKINMDVINLMKETYGDSEVINNKRDDRENVVGETLGFWIDGQENQAKNLSIEQQDLSRLKLDGRPRLIRGVAGSGKTVVLANLAARTFLRHQRDLYGRHSEYKILVLCYNKSFIPLLKEKIRVAFESQNSDGTILDDKIKISNSDAFFYGTLIKNGIIKIDNELLNYSNNEERDKFYGKLVELWNEQKKVHPLPIPKYDAIFIDEGQDLSENEYKLLLDFARDDNNKETNLIIFYDDAQNIYGRTRPNWSKIGINVVGDRTRVMKECFRSTKEIITIAFNVLLGTAMNQDSIVKTKGFADVDTLKRLNLIEELPEGYYGVHFAKRECGWPAPMTFETRDKEYDFICNELIKLIGKEEVRPEDILLLSFAKGLCNEINDKITSKLISQKLIQRTIRPYTEDDKNNYIFQPKCLTISTIHSAKGYDAPIVFLFGIDTLSEDEKGRAIFYVGSTRAKYKLYLTGKRGGSSLLSEANSLVEQFSEKYIE